MRSAPYALERLSYIFTSVRTTPNIALSDDALTGVMVSPLLESTVDQAHAVERGTRLQSSASRSFDAYQTGAPHRSPFLLRKVLLALELRWTVEDRVLIPSLGDTQGVMQGDSEEARRELEALRRLAALARQRETSIESQRVLVCVIETLASLRSQRVALALTKAQRAGMVDARTLVRQMDRLLAEWRSASADSGEIEDEVRDTWTCLAASDAA
jgi:hypothetical protein